MLERLSKLWPAVAGALVALALLYPEVDRDALVERGATRLLEIDASAPAPDSLLASLAARPQPPDGWRLELLRDGEPVDAPIAAGLPIAVAPPGAARAQSLRIEVRVAGDAVFLHPELPGAGPLGPWHLPGRSALVPPLLAIAVALAFRRTIAALGCGIWVGAALLRAQDGAGLPVATLLGAWDVFATYLVGELTDTFRLEIIGFVFALVAMVGVMTRSGGVQGLVELALRFARTTRSTLAAAFGLGCAIFFDDYSNCLIVGNTVRPLTDRLRISREKLAYVVDSTAAPIAGLSLLSTWIAFEVSTYAAQLPGAGITENPYTVFLRTLPFRFYCLFTLGFVLLVVLTGRDFGPMRRAEARARTTGRVVRAGGTPLISAAGTRIDPSPALPHRPRNALLPIATVIAVTLEEIFRQGGGFALAAARPGALLELESLVELLSAGGGVAPLFAGSCAGLAVAVFLGGSNATRIGVIAGAALAAALGAPLAERIAPALPGGLAGYAGAGLLFAAGAAAGGAAAARLGPGTRRGYLDLVEIRRAALASARALGFAVVILLEAWMIGRVCEDVNTADYLVALTSGAVGAVALPVLLFGAACLVSFATGTSWGTMSILLPNVVALAAAVGATHPVGPVGLVLVSIGAVLEGSIFGDHCSPISDTTVLSSVATASDHIDHVRTQMPYALTTAAAAVLAGYLPTLLFDWWSFPVAMLAGFAALAALLAAVGRPAPDARCE